MNKPSLNLKIDPYLFLPLFGLVIIGIFFIYSSGINSDGTLVSNEWLKQIIWAVLGLALYVVFSLVKYEFHREFSVYYYLFFLTLVLITVFSGKVVNGAKSWIGIGELGIQPSEFLKIATILYLAKRIDKTTIRTNKLFSFTNNLLVVALPILFILLQPDLGTSLVFIPIFLFVCYLANYPSRYVLFLSLIFVLTALFVLLPSWDKYLYNGRIAWMSVFNDRKLIVILISALAGIVIVSFISLRILKKNYFYWICYVVLIVLLSYLLSLAAREVLRDYQIKRLVVFLDPQIDARGAGWNIIQSITAVGSGGFWGKGFLLGTQSHLRYLPEQSTDFIFSIVSEEFGFVGGLLISAMYLVLILRGFYIASKARDLFGVSIATGISSLLLFHYLVNIGMTIGLMPITGIPLLFLSYGGSALLSSMIAIGLLNSVNNYRYQF